MTREREQQSDSVNGGRDHCRLGSVRYFDSASVLLLNIDVVSPDAHPSYLFFFFFNDTATTEIYTLSLHDALPIRAVAEAGRDRRGPATHSDTDQTANAISTTGTSRAYEPVESNVSAPM